MDNSTSHRSWSRPRRAAALIAGLVLGLLLLEGMARIAQSIALHTATRVENAPRDNRPIDDLFETAPPVLRILVLGDSMAYSPGIGRDALWSTRLEALLHQSNRPAEVVNLGRGGDNTFGQLQVLQDALKHQPIDLVLLLYNHNDVYGRRAAVEPTARLAAEGSAGQGDVELAPDRSPIKNVDHQRATVARLARWLRQRSHFSVAALARVGMQLRAWGILVPGTEFHHLARRAYEDDSPGWVAVKKEIVAMRDLTRHAPADFAIYVLPQFASLRHDFFPTVREKLAAHADGLETPIGFGFPAFEGASWRAYAMSPFDGHPNERANERIAELIFDWLDASGLLPAPRNPSDPVRAPHDN